MTGLLQHVTITRIRAGESPGDDDFGNPIPGASKELPIPSCSVQPGASTEVLGNRETEGIVWTVYAKGICDVAAHDQVRLPGDTRLYEVDGEPSFWSGGLVLPGQTVILLKKWEERYGESEA